MSISVDVHLLSGKSACLKVEADAFVESLKHRAGIALAVPSRGRLLNLLERCLMEPKNCHRSEADSFYMSAKCSFKPPSEAVVSPRSPRSWVTDLWSLGVFNPTLLATAVRYRISCEMCSRFKLLIRHSLQF